MAIRLQIAKGLRRPGTPGAVACASDEGYILLAVLFMMVLVLLMLSLAAPKVAASIERDREVELMHRGKQYRRAIQLYYRKFNAYPPSMDALEKTSEIRFLRKRYKDPLTGKDDWHLIHFGENKTPTAMGFFGQPLGGVGASTLAGVGPGGVGQSVGGSNGSVFGGSSFGGGSTGMTFGGSSLPGSQSATNPTSGAGASDGTTNGSANGSTDPNSTNSSLGSNTASTFGTSNTTSGQTFGGGGIIGVESTSPKPTILEYKKKKHFNEWEFTYDPISEQRQITGGSVGQPMSGAGNSSSSSFGSSNTFGNSFNNGNNGNNGIVNGTQQQQSQPTTPQQPQ